MTRHTRTVEKEIVQSVDIVK